MKRSKGFVHFFFVLTVVSTLLTLAGCNEQLKRMESNQVVLEEKIDKNARHVAMLDGKMERSYLMLDGKIEDVRRSNEIALAEAMATRYEQQKMREDTQSFDKKWFAGISRVEEKQRVLQASVNGVSGQAKDIDSGVKDLDAGQGAIQRHLTANQRQTDKQFKTVIANQHETFSTAVETLAAVETVGDQVAAVQQGQDAFKASVDASDAVLLGKADQTLGNQDAIKKGVNRNNTLAKNIQGTVGHIDQEQADFKEVQSERQKTLIQTLGTLEANHHTTQQAVSEVDATTKTLLTKTSAILEKQEPLTQSIRQEGTQTREAVKNVDQRQGQMNQSIETVQQTVNSIQADTQTLVANTTDIQKGQSSLGRMIQDQNDQIVTQVGDLKEGQGSLGTQIRDNRENLSGKVEALTQCQSGMTQALAGQKTLSEDLSRKIEQGQTQQGQMNQSLLSKSDELDQKIMAMQAKYDAWAKQIDAVSAKVQSLETSLTTLDTSLNTFQTNLTGKLTDLATLMKYYQQRQVTQGTQDTQEIKALAETLKQIKAQQDTLTERLDQVCVQTQQQGQTLKTALTHWQSSQKPEVESQPALQSDVNTLNVTK